MGKYAIVEGVVVVNVARADAPLGPNWFETQDAGPGWLYEDGMFSPPPDVPPSQEELIAGVDRERQRRIEAGMAFPVPDLADPIPLTGRPFDQSVYLALLMRAQGAAAAGITDPVLKLRAGDDVIHMLTPDQMIALISQAMNWFEQIMAVSWAMKDGDAPFEAGIPEDYADDAWWP